MIETYFWYFLFIDEKATFLICCEKWNDYFNFGPAHECCNPFNRRGQYYRLSWRGRAQYNVSKIFAEILPTPSMISLSLSQTRHFISSANRISIRLARGFRLCHIACISPRGVTDDFRYRVECLASLCHIIIFRSIISSRQAAIKIGAAEAIKYLLLRYLLNASLMSLPMPGIDIGWMAKIELVFSPNTPSRRGNNHFHRLRISQWSWCVRRFSKAWHIISVLLQMRAYGWYFVLEKESAHHCCEASHFTPSYWRKAQE